MAEDSTTRPLAPPTHILLRGDDVQLRVGVLPGAETVELALYRKSPGEVDSFDGYLRTAAGFALEVERIPELVEHLRAIYVWATTR